MTADRKREETCRRCVRNQVLGRQLDSRTSTTSRTSPTARERDFTRTDRLQQIYARPSPTARGQPIRLATRVAATARAVDHTGALDIISTTRPHRVVSVARARSTAPAGPARCAHHHKPTPRLSSLWHRVQTASATAATPRVGRLVKCHCPSVALRASTGRSTIRLSSNTVGSRTNQDGNRTPAARHHHHAGVARAITTTRLRRRARGARVDATTRSITPRSGAAHQTMAPSRSTGGR